MNYETLYNNIQAYTENTESLFVASIPVFVEEAEQRIYNSVNLPALRKNVTTTLTAGNQYLSLPNDYLATYSLATIDSQGVYSYLLNKDVSFIRESYAGNPALPQNQGLPKFYALFGSQYQDTNELSMILGPCPDLAYGAEMHYFYYPPTIVQGQVSYLDNLIGGSLYTNGIYQNVPLTGGSGANATADIQVVGSTVVSCTLKFGGNFYVVGDVLSCDSLGSTGNGFSITVTQVSNPTGTSWLGDNYDPVLFYGAMREAMLFMKQEQDLVAYYEQKFQEALQQLMRLSDGLERGDFYRDGQTKYNVNLKGNK